MLQTPGPSTQKNPEPVLSLPAPKRIGVRTAAHRLQLEILTTLPFLPDRRTPAIQAALWLLYCTHAHAVALILETLAKLRVFQARYL